MVTSVAVMNMFLVFIIFLSVFLFFLNKDLIEHRLLYKQWLFRTNRRQAYML